MKVLLTPAQERFISQKMKTGGYLSPDEVIREALRVYQLVEQEDYDVDLEDALRHSLSSPLKKYQPNHFSTLAVRRKKSRGR